MARVLPDLVAQFIIILVTSFMFLATTPHLLVYYYSKKYNLSEELLIKHNDLV